MIGPASLPARQRRMWVALGAAATAAIAVVLDPPPAALANAEGGARPAFAALTSAAIVALSTLLPAIVSRHASRPKGSLMVALAALILGVAWFALGGYAQRACTAHYGEKAVLIGSELTTLGATYKKENPDLSNDELLFDAAGTPERLWTASSIGRCRTLIASSYFLWIPFLVVCLVAGAEAILPATILAPAQSGAAPPRAAADATLRYDVFLSYRHHESDTAIARQLVETLEADGYRVAIDERDFLANASFLTEMERCIRESRFTVAVISSRYLESGNTEEEAIITKVLDMADRRRRLIPLVVEPVSMPAWLYGIVGIDLSKRDPLVDPIEKLKSTLGTPLAADGHHG
jgi:hypothetical protein